MTTTPEQAVANVAEEAAEAAAARTAAAVTTTVAATEATAAGAVASAQTAAALANSTAAQAEQTAADAFRLHTERVAEWQAKTEGRFQTLETSLETRTAEIRSEISSGMERLSSLLRPPSQAVGTQAQTPDPAAGDGQRAPNPEPPQKRRRLI